MPYASLSDVNVHLPADKAQAQDAEIVDLNIDALRLIRARLASTFNLTIINAWLTPATTPELIREIAGKLIAAKFYANLVAEDEEDGSKFAQGLYNEAITMLDDIRAGVITLVDVSGLELDNNALSETSFWPNNTTQAPSFSVADQWS